MDKNTILGIGIIVAILIGFGIYNQPSDEQLSTIKRERDSLAVVERNRAINDEIRRSSTAGTQNLVDPTAPDSVKTAQLQKEFGAFASAASGKQDFVTIENNKIRVKLSNRGGRIYSVELKDYRRSDSMPLVVFSGDSTEFGIGITSIGKSTNGLFFVPQTTEKQLIADKKAQTLTYRLAADSAHYIDFVYTLTPDDYQVRFEMQFKNMQQIITDQYLSLNWCMFMPQNEKGRDWEQQNSTIHYQYLDDEENEKLSPTKSDPESEKMTGRVKWFAFKDQFFSAIMKADDNFMKGGSVTLTPLPLDSVHISKNEAQMDVAYDGRPIGFNFYFGPNHFPTLKKYESGYESLLPLGWAIFGWINRFAVIPIFNFLSNYISNYGLIILLLTLIIKMVLFPLTYKSYLSTAKMRVLKPEIDLLNEKFPKTEQAMQKQQATMETYRRAGVNPMGGCLPMLLQIPILIAMFNFFPASIELRQKSFLWASDLSAYDSVLQLSFNIPFYGNHVSLFTIFMCISLVILTLWNNQTMTMPGGQQGVMKVMMWMMPVMMLFWFNNYASGLTYYYFIANTITIIQTWLIRRSVNDAEILAKLKENQKKPAPKSNFQQRLEAMAKRRQQMSKPNKK